MAQKFNPNEKLSPEELAKHLRQPTGDTGKEVGELMNKGNVHICINSYKLLKAQAGNSVLEIGMGNGFFVKNLIDMATNLNYVGVDFSATMVDEARTRNSQFIKNGTVRFELGSIEQLPFDDNEFDCVTTTNTIYFWPQPLSNAKELLRVLKPGGKLLIGYRAKSFMDLLELAKHGFMKYESHEVESLISEAGFGSVSTQIIAEPELEFDGKPFQMKGLYTIGLK